MLLPGKLTSFRLRDVPVRKLLVYQRLPQWFLAQSLQICLCINILFHQEDPRMKLMLTHLNQQLIIIYFEQQKHVVFPPVGAKRCEPH